MKLDWIGNCLTWFVLLSMAILGVLLVSWMLMPPVSGLSLWQEVQGGNDWEGMTKTLQDMARGR
jgi:hypothetical protein